MKKVLFLLMPLLSFALSAAEVCAEAYPCCKTVGIPAERPALFLIPVDGEIYRRTEPGLANLRIVSSSGEQVPYAVLPLPLGWKTEYSLLRIKGKIVGFREDKKANTATIEYELEKTDLPVGFLRLRTPDRDFDKSVTLEFDNGAKTEQFRFFDHAKNVRFRNSEFRFPPQKTRRIKIRIGNFAEKRAAAAALEHKGKKDTFTESCLFTRELRLEEICFFVRSGKTSPDPVRKILPLKELSREKKGRTTVIRLETGRRKIVSLHFKTSTPKYLREVEVRAVRRSGNAAAEHHFTKKIEPRIPEFLVEDFRADEYVVTIRNGDDPELAGLVISACIEEEALWLEGTTAPAGTLKLLYGGERSAAPQYGLRQYVSNLYGKEWKKLTASPETANPDFRNGSSGRFFQQAIGWIIGAAAVILAILARKSFSKIVPEKE